MRMSKRFLWGVGVLAVLSLAAGCATMTPSDQPPKKEVKPVPVLPTLSPEILARIEATFVQIPASVIPARYKDPQNRIRIPEMKVPAFMLSKYEVTQEDWVAVMGHNPSKEKDNPKLPVTNVSWLDAKRFIGRLNAAKGANVFRLSTAAEWEAACRAGAMGRVPEQATESALNQVAWWGKTSGNRTHPVGRLKPNAFGLYDMLGNVAEWCETAYDEKAKDMARVTAGSHFSTLTLVGQDCSTASYFIEDGREPYTGFRLAKDGTPAQSK